MDSSGTKASGAIAAVQQAAATGGPAAGTAPASATAAAGTNGSARAGSNALPAAPRAAPAQQDQHQNYPTPRTRIYYNPELSKFSLGEDHPMVPHRLHLTHRLAELWGLFEDPAVKVVREYPPATTDQLRRFHTDEYIAFLEYLDTLDLANMSVEEQQELLGEDLALFGLSVCRPSVLPGAEDGSATALVQQPAPLSRGTAAAAPPRGAAATGPASRPPQQQQAQRLPTQQPQRPKPEPLTQSGNVGRQQLPASATAAQQQVVKMEPKVEPKPSPTIEDVHVPPQLIALAMQLLTKLAPTGNTTLTPAQHQQLITYLRQHQLQMQQKLAAAAPAGTTAAAARGGAGGGAGAAGVRPALTMVRPGQVVPPGKLGQPGPSGGGGGSGSKKRKAESSAGGGKGGKGGGGGGSGNNKKRSKKKRRTSYSEDDDEEEEISDEDDDPPTGATQAADGVAVGAGAAAAGAHSRPSRQAATAVAALTNAVRRTEAEESDDDDSDEDDDEDDDDEGGDCPIFPGLLRYVGLQAAGSILAARDLASGLCDVAVHWGGGMHHGMPYRAFGFCYVNDLVLAILELMSGCGRVLYIDIDVHHGDGVETAFKRSEKVLSISLHKWDDGRLQATNDTLNHGKPQRPVFFPGTGKKNDLGEGQGKYFTVNVPLQDDITDDSYFHVYKAVVKTAFERFKPQAVVLQCGCDSVAGDKLGRFNLSIRGHARCVELVRDLCRTGGVEGGPPPPANPARGGSQWRVPLLVTGGGGYTPPLVARCWALETAVLLGRQLGEVMPPAVAKAEDLSDLGPSYFKEPGLSRPPTCNYHMCLDTIMLPHMHKQMDSDYSLSRLAAYLTSNMQRINIRDGIPASGDAATAGDDGAAADGQATAKDGDTGKDGATGAATGSSKSKSRKSAVASGPGVADPLKHLTAPTGYPDAEEYIQDQKDRVVGGAPWAAKMPPPPVVRGRKSGAAAGGSGSRSGAAAPGGKNAPAGPAGGGKGGGVSAAGAAVIKAATGGGEAAAAGGATHGTTAAAFVPVQVPGIPVIRPYKPKVATPGAAPAVAAAPAPTAAAGQ
ncbi:hypothetical protein VaNZ11_015489 [Volvox africanus]|uniref:Histone deacetylase domain-containing protein n=1 Tax=Volvox africanus TaxID=51714 RepID=A0ABQ5SN62_9CHLO|nr:hypothetical protein VaNZ11_015489 [Volvox africanus]